MKGNDEGKEAGPLGGVRRPRKPTGLTPMKPRSGKAGERRDADQE
jgi:hypothetical protein